MLPKRGVGGGFRRRFANVVAAVCGSLGGDDHRPAKGQDQCECDEGWTGINCNVCEADIACDSLVPGGEGGVCYKQGIAVKHNFQQCDVTSRSFPELRESRANRE